MSKTTLLIFWIIWLIDVLAALFAHREFIVGVFGRYAAPNSKYIFLWTIILCAFLIILYGSIYLKNHGQSKAALTVVSIPVVLALPYLLFLGAVILGGRNTNWH